MSLEDTVAIYSPYVIKIDGKIVDINESEVSFSSIPLTTNRFQKNYLQKKTFQVPCLNIKILQRRKSDKMPFVKEYIMLRPEEGTLRDKLKTEITKNLRCLVCQGQSVYDSDSEFAVSLKLVVENKIQQGLTEDQIYKFLTDKYGEWILYDPKFNKNTYLLWFLPLLILLLGGAIIVKKLIKIKK